MFSFKGLRLFLVMLSAVANISGAHRASRADERLENNLRFFRDSRSE